MRRVVRVPLPTCISATCVAVRTAGPGHEERVGTWGPAPSHPDLRTHGLFPSRAAQERKHRKEGRGHGQPPFESGNLIPALPSREETVQVGGVGKGRLYSGREPAGRLWAEVPASSPSYCLPNLREYLRRPFGKDFLAQNNSRWFS